jgi:hypothetical protein
MTLLGQHSVGQGLARLAGLWQVPKRRHSELRFKPAAACIPDKQSLVKASALYGGTASWSLETFASLEWLEDFARSGRQLLMCHALRLLEGWGEQRFAPRSLREEALVLTRLAQSAELIAAKVALELHQPLATAFQQQVQRLHHIRPHSSSEALCKARALLRAAHALREPAALHAEAAKLLDQALPHLIASDGGPLADELRNYTEWVHELLLADSFPFPPSARNALDRARPFLSMLLDSSHAYCFDHALIGLHDIQTTAPLRFASTSQVARLNCGKTVVIHLPARLGETTGLHVSSRGHRLMQASLFLHDAREDRSRASLSCEAVEQGQFLRHDGFGQRTAFLAQDGNDLRVEDELPGDGLKRWMRLDLNPKARVSIARNGTQATLAIDGKNLWQVNLRGARLMPARENAALFVETTHPCVNWALKRIDRTHNKAEKPDAPQLPF